ncbi:GNAT family N-acetyltransferase [Vibrio kasasachensis]|uniref:GNAT family N-acetyltransferase n=1 Tax=Vibrio kasasachensis TaxID=2910248 RepID=UPI003D0F6A8F
MSVVVRQGTLEECIEAVEAINEFIHKESVVTLSERLMGKRSLILVAEEQGKIIGFKIGYELDPHTFYSWFGGVSPVMRGKGIAQQLLKDQEAWVFEQGYRVTKVKSRNRFTSMLRLLIKNGYLIESVEQKPDLCESRIHFIKTM